MTTPERPQFPLHIVRPIAEQVLADLAANRNADAAYWIARLSAALQSMVDATAGDGDVS